MSKKHEYPKMLFKKGAAPITVHSEKEHQDAGNGWNEEPHEAIKGDKGDALDLHTQPEANSTAKDGADPKKGTDAAHGLK